MRWARLREIVNYRVRGNACSGVFVRDPLESILTARHLEIRNCIVLGEKLVVLFLGGKPESVTEGDSV